MNLRIIRRLNEPLTLKSWGYTEAGGLGEFDTSIYEELVLESLPEGWRREEQVQTPLAQGLDLVKHLEAAFAGASIDFRVSVQAALLPIKATLESATMNPLSRADFEGILGFAQSSGTLPKEQLDQLIILAQAWAGTVIFKTTN